MEGSLVLQFDLQTILQVLADLVRTKPTKLQWNLPQQLNKKTGAIMSAPLTVTDDHDVRVPLKWSDDVGPIAHPPLSGVTVVSDNPAVVSGGDVAADGMSVVLRTVGDGTCNVTVSYLTLKDVVPVTVAVPVPTALAADVADAVPVVKGTAA